MIWLKKLIKAEEGYGTIEMLMLIVGVSGIGYLISEKLLSVFQNLHQVAVKNIKGVSRSGL